MLRTFLLRSWLHRLTLITGTSLIGITPFGLMFNYRILDPAPLGFLVCVLGAFTLLVLVLAHLEANRPALHRSALVLLAVPGLLATAVNLFLAWYILPAAAVCIPLLAAIALLRRASHRMVAFTLWSVGFLVLFSWTALHTPTARTALLRYVPLLALVLFLAVRLDLFGSLPRGPVFAFASSAPLLCILGIAYLGITPEMTDRVVSQPGVRCLYDYTDMDQPLARAVGPSTFWILPDCEEDHYLVGTRITARLVRFSPRDPGAFAWLPLYADRPRDLIDGTSDVVSLACDPPVGYFGFRSHLFRLDPSAFRVDRQVSVPRRNFASGMVNIIRRDARHGRVACMVDVDRFLYFYDAETLEPRGEMAFPDHLWDFIIDADGNQLITSSTGLDGSRVRFYNLDTLALTAEINPGWFFAYVSLDEAGRRLFGASTISGDLVVVDVDRPAVRARIPVEPGIRYTAYDPHRNLVYVGGYGRGSLAFVDPDRREVLARYELGFRARTVFYSERTRKVTVTSSTGGFEIDPDRAISPTS